MSCILFRGDDDRQLQYIVDHDTDVTSLPTSTNRGSDGEDCVTIGSMAMSIESGKVFVLDSSDTWTEIGG